MAQRSYLTGSWSAKFNGDRSVDTRLELVPIPRDDLVTMHDAMGRSCKPMRQMSASLRSGSETFDVEAAHLDSVRVNILGHLSKNDLGSLVECLRGKSQSLRRKKLLRSSLQH